MISYSREVSLKHYADVNPVTPEFNALADGTELTFLPLENIWSGGKTDYSGRKLWKKSETSYTQFRRGDVLVPKVTPTVFHGRSVVALTESAVGLATSEVHVLRPKRDVDGRWITYNMLSSQFLDCARGAVFGVGGLQRISTDYLGAYKVLETDLETQQRIADYLDRETAEIDAAVADLDRYVELIKTRQLISEDATIWDGEKKRTRLKFLIDEIDERAGNSRTSWPLLSVSIHSGVQKRDVDDSKIQAVSDDLGRYKVVHPGDIVLNRMRAFQGALGISSYEGLTSPDYAVLRARDEAAAEWIALVMRSQKFVSQMAMNIRGIGSADQGNARTPRINVFQLLDIRVPVLDRGLRERLVSSIRGDQNETNQLIAQSTRLRDLLLKRRSVLITDVVTGRKQV